MYASIITQEQVQMILDELNNISSDSASSRVALYLVIGSLLALSLLNGRGAK